MAFDFPASPSNGQSFSPAGGPTWVYDAARGAWMAAPLPPSGTADRLNRIINGNGQHSQEVGSSGTGANGSYFCDQWLLGTQGMTGGGAFRAGTLSPNGSQTCMALNITTAKPSLAASDIVHLYQYIEGYRVADLNWGNANAKPVVLRFAASSPVVGTYTVNVRNLAGNRTWLGSYTITAANTWQEFVLVIPGDTTGTWPKDHTAGMLVSFCFASGSNWMGVPGWQAGNLLALPGMANGAAVIGQPQITDVGLYADPLGTGLAPKWEPTSYEDDLFDCQRYFQKTSTFFWGAVTSGFNMYGSGPISPPMRTSPVAGSFVNVLNQSFAATTGGVGYYLSGILAEFRAVNATAANGAFISNWNLSARM